MSFVTENMAKIIKYGGFEGEWVSPYVLFFPRTHNTVLCFGVHPHTIWNIFDICDKYHSLRIKTMTVRQFISREQGLSHTTFLNHNASSPWSCIKVFLSLNFTRYSSYFNLMFLFSAESFCPDCVVCFGVLAFRGVVPSTKRLKLILNIIKTNPYVTFEVLTAVNMSML